MKKSGWLKSIIFLFVMGLFAVACQEPISLHEASRVGNLQWVKEHIASGTDLNAKDKDGWTALKAARQEGYTEIVNLLRAAGAK